MDCCSHCGGIFEYSKNPAKLVGDHIEIVLLNRKGKLKKVALIDIADWERIKFSRWSIGDSYVGGHIPHERVQRLHNFLMNPRQGSVVDHINGDVLDNRRSNLRIVSFSANAFNRKNGSSPTGVFFDKVNRKWAAHIMKDYKSIWLGRYERKYDAIQARKKAELKYFGENPSENHKKK